MRAQGATQKKVGLESRQCRRREDTRAQFREKQGPFPPRAVVTGPPTQSAPARQASMLRHARCLLTAARGRRDASSTPRSARASWAPLLPAPSLLAGGRGRRAASSTPSTTRPSFWAPPTPAHRLRAASKGLEWKGGQDRVNSAGELVVGGVRPSGPPPIAVVGARASPGRSTVPESEPLSTAALDALADAVASALNVVVLTGAGTSTASGVPDYRSPGRGAYATGFVPVTHQQFVSSASARARVIGPAPLPAGPTLRPPAPTQRTTL